MNFRSKIWPRHSLRRPRFPIKQMHFHYRVTFTGYIRCFCATTSHDLVTLTFDLLTLSVSCTVLLVSDPHTNFYYPMTIGYWVSSRTTEYLITFPLSETVTAHAPCHVTSNRGKNSPHFWNPWPQFAYSLCHFHGVTTKIKPCYKQKIAFSHYEGTSSHLQWLGHSVSATSSKQAAHRKKNTFQRSPDMQAQQECLERWGTVCYKCSLGCSRSSSYQKHQKLRGDDLPPQTCTIVYLDNWLPVPKSMFCDILWAKNLVHVLS